jgi:hypothetical protein
MPDPNRTYTEKEIQALLERTAQLQAQEAESPDSDQEGLSLAELEAIAGDAGLDPQFLHRAALEMEHSGGKPIGKNKTKTHVRVDRVLPSDLSDEEWEDIVFALKRRYESDSYDMDMGLGMGSYGRGKIEQIGRSREWRHTSLSGVQTSVLLRPHKKGTSLEISQRVGIGSTKTESWAYGTPFAILFAVIIGAIAKSVLLGSVALVGLTALFVPLVFYLDTQWREKKHNTLVEVADELQQIVMRDAGDVQTSATSASAGQKKAVSESESRPRIDIPEADAEPESHKTGSQRLQDRS